MRTKRVKIASLVLDYGLYPRHEMDSSVTSGLARSMEAGETLPAVVVDSATNKVVDGFHRCTAALHVYGEDAEIAVEFREYRDEGELFLDAVRLNARHGYRLTKYDQARCMIRAEELHVDKEAIAGALSVTVDFAAKLKAAKTAYTREGEPVPLKRGLRHLSGETLTAPQMEFNRHASGWPPRFHAEQLFEAITSGSIDWDDETTVKALDKLARLLSERMAVAS